MLTKSSCLLFLLWILITFLMHASQIILGTDYATWLVTTWISYGSRENDSK